MFSITTKNYSEEDLKFIDKMFTHARDMLTLTCKEPSISTCEGCSRMRLCYDIKAALSYVREKRAEKE